MPSAPPTSTDTPPATGRVARGAEGAGLLRRVYRASPLRQLIKIEWDHRGIGPTDVFLASYPRSGSSWLRFLMLELLAGDASFAAINVAVPYVGRHRAAPSIVPDGGRVIKTHEPYLARYRRAVHLVRDPRDVALSYYRFMQRIGKLVIRPGDDERASLDQFIGALLDGRVDAHGTWQTHLLSWRHATDAGDSDILMLRYEDLRHDPRGGVTLIAQWLGLTIGPDEADRVAQRCTIERMREAEAFAMANTPKAFARRARTSGVPLINEGRVAGWRAALDGEQQQRFGVFADGLAMMGYPPVDGTSGRPADNEASAARPS